MKPLYYILLAIAVILIVVNAIQLDFSNLFAGKSLIALIGIVASLCVILIVMILRVSKKIEQKVKEQN